MKPKRKKPFYFTWCFCFSVFHPCECCTPSPAGLVRYLSNRSNRVIHSINLTPTYEAPTVCTLLFWKHLQQWMKPSSRTWRVFIQGGWDGRRQESMLTKISIQPWEKKDFVKGMGWSNLGTGSQPGHQWHFWPDNSLLWGVILLALQDIRHHQWPGSQKCLQTLVNVSWGTKITISWEPLETDMTSLGRGRG